MKSIHEQIENEMRLLALTKKSCCGYCGEPLDYDGEDIRCTVCKTYHSEQTINAILSGDKLMETKSFTTFNPVF